MIFGLSKELNQELSFLTLAIPRSQRVSLVMKPRRTEILKAPDALCDEAAELFVRRLTFFPLLGCIPHKARTLNHSYLKLHKMSLLSNGRSFLRPLPPKQTNKQGLQPKKRIFYQFRDWRTDTKVIYSNRTTFICRPMSKTKKTKNKKKACSAMLWGHGHFLGVIFAIMFRRDKSKCSLKFFCVPKSHEVV